MRINADKTLFNPPIGPVEDRNENSWRDLQIVPRSAWDAKIPKWRWPLNDHVGYVLCTYTEKYPCVDSETCIREMQYLQGHAMQYDDNPDIRFNFLIGGDANVYEGRGWTTQPRVPMRYGKLGGQALYIAFIGHFKFKPPSWRMFRARDDLLKFGTHHGFIKPKFLLFTM